MNNGYFPKQDWFVFVMETQCVFCVMWTEYLYVIYVISKTWSNFSYLQQSNYKNKQNFNCMLNAAFAMAILHLISCVHFASFVIMLTK
jgi:hypothetical protein